MIITRYARCRAIEVAFSDAKTCPACIDMIVRLRRVLIGAQFRRDVPASAPEEIRALQLAWAEVAAQPQSRI